MVQNKSKKAKQAVKAPPVNNESEPQAAKNTPAENHTENENEINPVANIEPKINGERDNVAEPETSSSGARSAIKSQMKKTAEIESTKTTVSEKGEEKSTVSQSKTKGRPKKDKNMEGDIVETTADEPQSSEATPIEESEEPSQKPISTRKRKAASENKAEKTGGSEAASPPKKSHRTASSKDKTDVETETSVPEKKYRKRKIELKTETKSVKKVSPVTKSKKQKVPISIPSVKSISGKVFVIGQNDVGQLGFGEEVEVKKRPALLDLPYSIIDICAGGMHSVCLTESGEVVTFGCNDEAALGRITSNEAEEASPGKVEIPERVVQISAGDSHTAALTESGQVYIWGNFRSGDGPMGLISDGVKQVKPVKILTGIKIVKISSGTEHLACLSSEGIVYTCGCGENGQLGRFSERWCRDGGRKGRAALLEPAAVPVTGHPNSKTVTVLIEDIWTGSYCTFLKAQETGLIYAFGLNNYNHLGYENERVRFVPKQVASYNSRTWKQITGGQHHTLALDSDGLVYAMGRNDYGRLGLGENCEEKSSPTLITSLANENCSSISCGNCVSYAITEESSLYSWGFGDNNQLGHGNDEDCHVPRLVEGNFLNSWKALKVSGGGQHTLVLATPKESVKSDKK